MDFAEILKRMPEIARAVNAFSSEIVQQQAFTALLDGLADRHDENNANQPAKAPRQISPAKKAKATSTARQEPQSQSKKTAKKKSGPKMVTELNLRPNSKGSLRDFIEKKKPGDNQKRFAVITYYLQKTLGTKNISADHMYTAFKDIAVKVPLNIDGGLLMTAKRKGWLDTSNLADVKLTVAGENFVEHDLPPKTQAK